MKHASLLMAASVGLFALAGSACSDDDGGAAGSAGTAGTAGTGGSAGTGGTGGSGGTAGTAGTAGAAGSGGSAGTAGSGGSSGSGGAGGTTGDRCEACLDQRCAAQGTACDANADCVAIFGCVIAASCGEIPEPLVCIQECVDANPNGQTAFDPMINCILDTCGTECSGS